jgi:hypothetical protein
MSAWTRLALARDIAIPFLPRRGAARFVVGNRRSHISRHLYAALRPLGVHGYQVRPRALTARGVPPSTVRVDGFHLHWPEHLGWSTPEQVTRLRLALDRLHIPVVWTQHNLVPHADDRDDDWATVYRMWAAEALLVIHHSSWGEQESRSQLDFRSDAHHVVIPFGPLSDDPDPGGIRYRARRDSADGLITLGIAGAPRGSKQVQQAIEVVESLKRHDMRLIVIRGSGQERVSRPDRVQIRATGWVSPEHYLDALAGIDALLFPHEPPYQLGTGVAGDVIGAGIAAITSNWPFLAEYFDGGAIVYGSGSQDLRACLEEIDREELAACANRVRLLQRCRSWPAIAHQTADALSAAGIGHFSSRL